MGKRQLILNGYKTADSGLWTLSSCIVTKAAQVQNLVLVPGRYAPLDLSTALTNGQPYYDNSYLEARLESSEGSREERQARITQMVNLLDGRQVKITLPDRTGLYLIGRIQVNKEYNDLAHCSVVLSALCDPWLYNESMTVVSVNVTNTSEEVDLVNAGRLSVTPTVEVTGEVTIILGTNSATLAAGTYLLPWLYLAAEGGPAAPNTITPTVSGSGSVTFSYREGVLAE